MCNRLFISALIVMWSSLSVLKGQIELHPSYQLSGDEKLDEGLYLNVLKDLDHPIRLEGSKELRAFVLSTMGERLPELEYALAQSPTFLLEDPSISGELVKVLKEETSMGISPEKNENWNKVKDLKLNKQDLSSIQFLFAYDLFRKKKFKEAQKGFDQVLKYRNAEFEYAFYYAGLSALLLKDYEKAESYLSKVGKTPLLKNHTPYYLAVCHYGQRDYQRIVDFYAPRIKDSHLFNYPSLVQLIALSHYHQGEWNETLVCLSILASLRDLSPEENYIKGISSKKLGLDEASLNELAMASIQSGSLKVSSIYEQAMILTNQKKYSEAIVLFESIVNSPDINPYDLQWNILLLYHKAGNYDKAAQIAIKLYNSNPNPAVKDYLSQLIEIVDHQDLYTQLISKLASAGYEHTLVKRNIYNRAVNKLKDKNPNGAKFYFNLLSSIYPKIEEHGEIAAWQGILAYQDKNYNLAKEYLLKYTKSKSTIQPSVQLDFDVNYFLAYCFFKEKNEAQALGYFGNAYKILGQAYPNDNIKKEDILLRLGDTYFLLNDFTNAIAAYDQAQSIDGQFRDYILYQKAIIAELQSKPYDKIFLLDELVSNYGGSAYYYKAQFMIANTLFSLGKFEKAGQYYTKLMHEEVPTDLRDEAILQMGLIYVNAGEYQSAEKYYKQILANSTNDEFKKRAHLGLKEIYSDYTYNTEAYLALEQANAGTTEKNDKILFDLAVKTMEEGKEEVAILQFKELVDKFPNSEYHINAIFHLATLQIKAKAYQDGITNLEKVVAAPTHELTLKSYNILEEVIWEKTASIDKYIQIEEQRRLAMPKENISKERVYRYALSLLTNNQPIKESQIADILKEALYSDQEKYNLINLAVAQMVNSQDWKSIVKISTIAESTSLKLQAKQVYFKALGLFNLDDISKTVDYITSSYDALLTEPAWFAKSIILLSDAYTLLQDYPSAKAALQALIESESAVPASLKSIAQNRLDNLKLQN